MDLDIAQGNACAGMPKLQAKIMERRERQKPAKGEKMNYPPLKIQFEIGKRQNVRLGYTDRYGELIREVTATRWYKDRLGYWFEWRWKPESGKADLANNSGYDCGFAGMLMLNLDGSPHKGHAHFLANASIEDNDPISPDFAFLKELEVPQ